MYLRRWLFLAVLVCGLSAGCSDFNTNLTTQTSTSTLTFVSPASVLVGSVPSSGLPITATGTGFVTGAIILWNAGPGQTAVQLPTTLVSSTQLTAVVPATLFGTAGQVFVAVQIPGSAVSGASNIYATNTTEVSNVIPFLINNPGAPGPAISSITPSSTGYCAAAGFTLTVNGSNFTSGSVINWNGSPRVTTFVSATQLTAAILPTDTALAGAAGVTVSNSAGTSSATQFTLTTPASGLPAPTIASLSQTAAAVGGAAVTLTVTGGNISPCSVVQWISAGSVTSNLATNYVSATQLTATIPAANLLTLGAAQVVIFTGAPGGGTSSPLPFTVMSPTVTSLSSSTTSTASASYCSATGFTLTVNGANFVNGSVVNWNGSPRPTAFLSATQVTAQISASDAALPVNAAITVSNPASPSAVASNSLPFSVTAPTTSLPAPSVTTLSPARAVAGTAAFTLNVSGAGFAPCSVVQWNGSSRPTTFVSATQLNAAITAVDIAALGTAQVTVFTLPPGGGTSGAVPFQIVAPTLSSLSPTSTPFCSSSGLTLTVNGTDFVNGLVVNWNGSPRPTTFVNSTQLTAAITATDAAFQGTATVTVSSAASSSNSLTFTMTVPTTGLPAPVITSLAPANATAGGNAFLLTANGSNLLPCSVVQWNGSSRTTQYIGTTGINASISAADIATAGSVPVTVSTPTPGGGTSNAIPFTIFATSGAAQPAVSSQARLAAASAIGSGSADSLPAPVMSVDNRYQAFVLASTDGSTEIPGSTENIFVRDTCQGAAAGCTPLTAIQSLAFNSNPADGNSISPSISADGRYVTFISSATNLVDSDTNGAADVFVRDTCAGASSGCAPTTQRVSISTNGIQGNAASASASISADGRYVTFRSAATNLDPSSPISTGVFLRDTCAGADSSCKPSTQQLN
jgi:hypothetical protein